jgi:hypothetical protein
MTSRASPTERRAWLTLASSRKQSFGFQSWLKKNLEELTKTYSNRSLTKIEKITNSLSNKRNKQLPKQPRRSRNPSKRWSS